MARLCGLCRLQVFSFTIWFFIYCSILYSAYFLLDNMITDSSFSLCFSLSVSHTHTHTQTYTYTHTHTESPLTAHLTPETSEPWEGQMVDAGWGLVCVCTFLCTSQCENEHYQERMERDRERRRAVCAILCVCPVPFPSRLGSCFLSLDRADISCSLLCCLPVSSVHPCVQRFAVEMLSAVLGSTRLASCLALIRAGG